jgi:hypothetical protein
MPHVYFSFSIMALNELEGHFTRLAYIINQREKEKKRQKAAAEEEEEVEDVKEGEEEEEVVLEKEENQEDRSNRLQELTALFRLNGIEVRSPIDLQHYLNHLNDITRSCSFMYVQNKEKIHFAQDIMLDKYLGFRNDPNRQHTWIRHRSKFMDTVLSSVESYRVTLEEMLRAQHNVPKFDHEATPASVRKLALHNYDDNQPRRHIKAMRDSYDTAIAFYRQKQKARSLITGFENYVVELDNAVKKAMYGKDHVS